MASGRSIKDFEFVFHIHPLAIIKTTKLGRAFGDKIITLKLARVESSLQGDIACRADPAREHGSATAQV